MTENAFKLLWINTSYVDSNEKIPCRTYKSDHDSSSKSWKEIQLEKINENERQMCQQNLNEIYADLSRIKNIVSDFINANETETESEKFSMQFFNVDVEKIEQQRTEMTEKLKTLEIELSEQFSMGKLNIENIGKYMFDCFKVDSLRIRELFNSVFIENYSLTHLDRRFIDDGILEHLEKNPMQFDRICKMEPGIRYNLIHDTDLCWLEMNLDSCSEGIERFMAAVMKVIDSQLSTHTSWTLDFNSTVAFDEHVKNITNVNEVFSFNIKAYVS